MDTKKYKLKAADIKALVPNIGGCLATDKITVEGKLVGFMYREEPDNDLDRGWRMLAGDESDAYLDNPGSAGVYEVNTIANYDPAIIPYLQYPYGAELERIKGSDQFKLKV